MPIFPPIIPSGMPTTNAHIKNAIKRNSNTVRPPETLAQ